MRYFDEARYQREVDQIFNVLPQPVAHVSELSQKDAFVRAQMGEIPLLLTRDSDEQINAFINVCRHKYGFIWVWPIATEKTNVDDFLDGLGEDFEWFDAASHALIHSDEKIIHANWKIIVEGGIEAYHFKIAHRNTIGPYFNDNLSSYQTFGPHMRSFLTRNTLKELNNQSEDTWQLREHA